MKKQILNLSCMFLAIAFTAGFAGCKKKSDSKDTPGFSLTALKAGSIDLLRTTPATHVQILPVITATFSLNLDAASVNSGTVLLTRGSATNTTDLTLTAAGNSILITPTAALDPNTLYGLTLNGLRSADGQTLSKTSASFTTSGIFVLVSLKSGTLDLNGPFPANNVPVLPVIKAIFTDSVNSSTANASTITLIKVYDSISIGLTIVAADTTILITPTADLDQGCMYTLKFNGIRSMGGQTLPTISRTFVTLGKFIPAGVIAYWNFENNVNDQTGSHNADFSNITYAYSYSTSAGKAGQFDGLTSIAEIPGGDQLDNTNDFSIAFWVKAVSDGHFDSTGNPKGQFVFGLGGFSGFEFEMSSDYGSCKVSASYTANGGSTFSEDIWFQGDGKTLYNGGWQGWTFCKDLTGSGGVKALIKDVWAHIVCTYNSTTKIGTLYINGEKMKAQDFNLWPSGSEELNTTGLKYSGTEPEEYPVLAFGFIKSRNSTIWNETSWGNYNNPSAYHFKGLLDDVRIWHKAITSTEISLMYDSEKP